METRRPTPDPKAKMQMFQSERVDFLLGMAGDRHASAKPVRGDDLRDRAEATARQDHPFAAKIFSLGESFFFKLLSLQAGDQLLETALILGRAAAYS